MYITKDRVIVITNEPGFITKMHELREKGYTCTGCGDGKMIFELKEEVR